VIYSVFWLFITSYVKQMHTHMHTMRISMTKNDTIKAYGGEWRYTLTHPSTSALNSGKWSASCPGRFTLRKEASSTHQLGVCVDPRCCLDNVNKSPYSCHESNHSLAVHVAAQSLHQLGYPGSLNRWYTNLI
jgi:hypothetical protein